MMTRKLVVILKRMLCHKMKKSDILDLARQEQDRWREQYPSFHLYTKLERGFAKCLASLESEVFSGADYQVMNQLRETFQSMKSLSSCWAQLFIELWFCSNFSASSWSKLVNHDRTNICCVIEHFYHVITTSGANGHLELAKLLNQTNSWSEAESKFEELAPLDEHSADWITRLCKEKV